MKRELKSLKINKKEQNIFSKENISIQERDNNRNVKRRNLNSDLKELFFDEEEEMKNDNSLINNIFHNNRNNNISNQRGHKKNRRVNLGKSDYKGNNKEVNLGTDIKNSRYANKENFKEVNKDNDNNENINNERDNKKGFKKMYEKDKGKSEINIKYPTRNRYISYYKMEKLYNGDINDVILFLYNEEEFDEVIKATHFKIEMAFMFMNILRRIIESNSIPSYHIISTLLNNTNFFKEQVKQYIIKTKNIDIKYLRFINDYLFFYKKVLDKFSGDNQLSLWSLELLVKELQKKCNQINEREQDNFEIEFKDISTKIIDNYNEIKKKLEAKNDDFLVKRFKNLNLNNPNDKNNSKYDKIAIDYKEKQLEISKEELIQDIEKEIVPHLTKGSYLSYERYLNTLFYLEYEDCYRSLKKTIKSLYSEKLIDPRQIEKKYIDIYYYFNASIPKIEATNTGIILTIDFQAPKRVKFTKRMIYGSLLIISNENLSDFLFVTVHYNPYIKNRNKNIKQKEMKLPQEPKYRILVKLVNSSQESFKFLINYRRIKLQIFESKAYFESYIHILRRLQKINTKELPFKNELIDGNFKDIKANYLTKNKYIIFDDTHFELNKTFPLSLNSQLDITQKEALELCLNNKIALIQGPPGTGKTYIGGIFTNILLQNINSPILVVCYTNHALDQFIEHIMNYTKKIVRIGGKCSNDKVKEFSIRKLRPYKRNMNIINQINELCDILNNYFNILDYKGGIRSEDVQTYFPNIFQKIINDFYLLIGYRRGIVVNESYLYKKNELFKCWINKRKITEIYDLFGINENKYYLFDYFCKINNTQVFLRKDGLRENIIDDNNENIYNNYNNDNNNNNNDNNNSMNYNESEDDEDEVQENIERLEYLYNESFENEDKKDSNSDDELTEEVLDLRFRLTKGQIKNIIENNNLWEIGPQIRKEIINYMKEEILLNKDFFSYDLIKKYENTLNKKITTELMEDSKIIKKNKIIAMTTTGCSKYSTILEQNEFEVVIIEEAAEVLEPHIISLLTKHTKHLIMIGDHKQLRPKPYNYELISKYHFDISLFERLINNGIPFKTLKYQRRMKSIFADFVRLIYGDQDYKDYVDSNNKENLKGIAHDMFIITHNYPETEDINLSSKKNEFEAKYLIKLCKYFLNQGYKDSQITILTFYVGQVLLLRKICRNEKILNIKISSIDNYQGEENDIILLSLVRSNSQYNIGFLRNFNRVCVAFSRAKLGFIIVGNIDCLIKGEEKAKKEKGYDSRMDKLWFKINELAKKKEIISNQLTLMCQKHKNKTIISNLNDFSKIPEGGCQKVCGERLECGHQCELLCHPYSHKGLICRKPCQKILACGHKCTKLCFEKCGNCLTKVWKNLPCGHSNFYECYLTINEIDCLDKCNKIRKCGHKCKLKCFENCESKECVEEVERQLLCGHIDKFECYLSIYQCKCKIPCNVKLKCGHICTGNCGRCLMGTLHIPCVNKCEKQLICGHKCQQKCSQECLCKENCVNECIHNHCNKLCYQNCSNCTKSCEIGCEHRSCLKLCYEICDIPRCNIRCEKKLKCEHQCMGICGERCPNLCKICPPNDEQLNILSKYEKDDDPIFYETKCGHCFEVREMDNYMEQSKSLNMILCPKCNNILFDEPRYQYLIKSRFNDIHNITNILLIKNKKEGYLEKSQNIIKKIEKEIKSDFISSLNVFKKDLMKYVPDTSQVYSSFNPKITQANTITAYNILTQLPHFVAIEYFQKTLLDKKELSSLEKKYLLNYNIIKEYFIGYKSFNNDFFEDFQKKIKNLLCFIKVQKTMLLNDINRLNNLLLKFNETNFNCLNEDLEQFKIISQFESQKILKKLGTEWYKCPNGHYYMIDECGGNINNQCPYCGINIQGNDVDFASLFN